MGKWPRHLTVFGAVLIVSASTLPHAYAGSTERFTVSSTGAQGNEDSEYVSGQLSSDGRFLAFQSEASNLVPGDTNGVSDVMLRDRLSGTTVRTRAITARSSRTPHRIIRRSARRHLWRTCRRRRSFALLLGSRSSPRSTDPRKGSGRSSTGQAAPSVTAIQASAARARASSPASGVMVPAASIR